MAANDSRLAWTMVLTYVEGLPAEMRVQALQKYIQEGGPVPDILAARARAILETAS